jgi:hypothetical protein
MSHSSTPFTLLGMLAALGTAVLLAACNGGGGSPTQVPDSSEKVVASVVDDSVWEYKLAQGGRVLNYGRWYNYIQTDDVCESGVGFPLGALSPAACWNFLTASQGPQVDDWVASQGPWWIDPNHQQIPGGNGFGMINVIGFMRLPSAINSAADLTNAEVSFDSVTYPGFSTVTAPSKLGTLKSHVWLWFQTAPREVPNCTPDDQIGENCTRQSDYILTGNLGPAYQIDSAPNGGAVARRFVLDPTKASQWTCLGAGLNVKYDCLPFDQAIKQISVIGFIAGPVLPCPVLEGSSPPICDMAAIRADVARYFNVGQIAFRNFNIKQTYTRQTALYDQAWQPVPDGAVSSQPGWSAITYGERTTFKPGNGLRLHPGTGYTRLGISSADNTQDFSQAGPQIYLADWEPVQGLGGGQIRIVSAGADGRYTVDRFVATYNTGDAVELLFTADALAVLKNGEVVHRFAVSCSPECSFHPYASQLQRNPGQLPLRF